MIFRPKRVVPDQDWSEYIVAAPTPKKRQIIEECKKRGVTIFIDEPTETSDGAYSHFRPVASEIVLQNRLFTKAAATRSIFSIVIAFIALFVSIIALVKSFL